MLALGDITERCLRFFGITKERVQAVTGKKDCGCAKRQAAMNQWGYRRQYRLMLPYYWLREKWLQSRYGAFGMRVWLAGRYMGMAFRVLFYGR
jgi:hypothetical protein